MMVFQEFDQLLPWRTVKENVMFPLRASGRLPRKAAEEQALDYIAKVNLSAFADSYPHTLSGGMKQRVAIARTLVNNPRVVLMDEPFGALDPQTRWGMQSLLLEVSRAENNTILFVTHDVSEAVYLGDTIYVLSQRPARILHQVDVPAFPVRDIALKSAPEFRAVEKKLLDLIYAPVRN
jgi:NitT/TauT family transport system ATP-binding protein